MAEPQTQEVEEGASTDAPPVSEKLPTSDEAPSTNEQADFFATNTGLDDEDGLDLDIDDETDLGATLAEEEPEVAPAVEAAPEPEKPEATPPAPEPEAAPTTEAVPAVEPQAEPPPQEVPPALTQEELQAQYKQYRTTVEAQLADGVYKLSDEMVEGLENDPRSVVPQLLARVHMDAAATAVHQVLQALPNAVNQALAQRTTATGHEDVFYQKWPQLDRANAAQTETIVRLGLAYRQGNPGATPEQFIQDVGASAMLSLGVPLVEAAPVEVPAPTPPFKPAGRSAPSAGKPARPTNPIAAFDQLFDEEELDLD